MDSIILLGQKNTLAEYIILSDADNRPPMLDKDLMIPESVENGPLIWPTVEENGVTRIKKYAELSVAEKIQADCDMKLHAYLEQHELHANEVRLIRERNQDPLALSQMNHQTSTVPQIAYQSPQVSTQPMTESPLVDSSLVVLVFSPGYDPISYLNKAMDFLTVVASSRQCTQPKRPRNAAWYKDKAMLAEAQEAGQILDEEQLAFLADPGVQDGQAIQTIIPNNAAFQTEDLDTYDSDCDDISNAKAVLMANISNYGSDVISEVPHSETYLNDIENQSMHAMQDFEQTSVVDVTDNEITSDSNINPYSQYLQETQ
ncbi:hypothetical protein Tco_0327300 [Tanacetum coccineum]